MDEKILEELTLIRTELQNIRVIFQSKFVSDYTVERQKVDGKTIRIRHTLEDPLGDLRKRYNIGSVMSYELNFSPRKPFGTK